MQRRHLCDRQLDAQIAARHHDALRRLDNLVQIGQRGRFLDLRQYGGAALRQRHSLFDVRGALHKGQSQPVDAKLAGEFQIRLVLVGKRGQRQHHVRHVHALTV